MIETSGNDEQVEYWNEEAGPKWVAQQEILDRQIRPLGERMLDVAAITEGERVCDTGCGCGDTTLEIARRIGSGGNVTGFDISKPMLERARERADSEGLRNIKFRCADAQTHAFDVGKSDLVTSRFGVMFFGDPVIAFGNLRTALKSGGRLAFICWRSPMENQWISVPLAAAAQHIELPTPPDPGAPGPFSLADADRTRNLLTDAGFSKVQIDPCDLRLPIGGGGDLDKALEFIMEIGPVSRALADSDADEATREKVRVATLEAMRPFHTSEGVVVDWAAWIVSAQNL